MRSESAGKNQNSALRLIFFAGFMKKQKNFLQLVGHRKNEKVPTVFYSVYPNISGDFLPEHPRESLDIPANFKPFRQTSLQLQMLSGNLPGNGTPVPPFYGQDQTKEHRKGNNR